MGHITFTILLESICCWALCPSNIFKHIDHRWRIQGLWIFDNEEIVDTWRKVSTCRTLSETACNFPLSMGKKIRDTISFSAKFAGPFLDVCFITQGPEHGRDVVWYRLWWEGSKPWLHCGCQGLVLWDQGWWQSLGVQVFCKSGQRWRYQWLDSTKHLYTFLKLLLWEPPTSLSKFEDRKSGLWHTFCPYFCCHCQALLPWVAFEQVIVFRRSPWMVMKYGLWASRHCFSTPRMAVRVGKRSPCHENCPVSQRSSSPWVLVKLKWRPTVVLSMSPRMMGRIGPLACPKPLMPRWIVSVPVVYPVEATSQEAWRPSNVTLPDVTWRWHSVETSTWALAQVPRPKCRLEGSVFIQFEGLTTHDYDYRPLILTCSLTVLHLWNVVNSFM